MKALVRLGVLAATLLDSSIAFSQNEKIDDFDVSCAVSAGWKAGKSKIDGEDPTLFMMTYNFYLGRLTSKNDNKNWTALIKRALPNPKLKELIPILYPSCIDFLMKKIEQVTD